MDRFKPMPDYNHFSDHLIEQQTGQLVLNLQQHMGILNICNHRTQRWRGMIASRIRDKCGDGR